VPAVLAGAVTLFAERRVWSVLVVEPGTLHTGGLQWTSAPSLPRGWAVVKTWLDGVGRPLKARQAKPLALLSAAAAVARAWASNRRVLGDAWPRDRTGGSVSIPSLPSDYRMGKKPCPTARPIA
jgi:hypothetical protein